MASQSWREQMDDLERFAAGTGELPRSNARLGPDQIVPRVDRLANFLHDQRRNRHRLDAEQTARVERLPGFSWDPLGDAWNANVSDYGTFFQTHGRVPSRWSSDPREKRLGAWASEQSSLYNGLPGRTRTTPERIAQLQAIPGWEFRVPMRERPTRVDELAAFTAQHRRTPKLFPRGRTPSPEEKVEHSLAVWLSVQRTKARRNQLDADSQATLEQALGESLT